MRDESCVPVRAAVTFVDAIDPACQRTMSLALEAINRVHGAGCLAMRSDYAWVGSGAMRGERPGDSDSLDKIGLPSPDVLTCDDEGNLRLLTLEERTVLNMGRIADDQMEE